MKEPTGLTGRFSKAKRAMVIIGTFVMVIGFGLAVYGFVRAEDVASTEPVSAEAYADFFMVGAAGLAIGVSGLAIFVLGFKDSDWSRGIVVRRGVIHPVPKRARQDTRPPSSTRRIELTGLQSDPDLQRRFGDFARLSSKSQIKEFRKGDIRLTVSRSPTDKKFDPPFSEATFWSFKTSLVVASETLERGVARMSAEMASMMHMSVKPGTAVTATYEGRSKELKLLVSDELHASEFEMNNDDLEELGVSEGGSGTLEIASLGSSGFETEAEGRGAEVDTAPPQELEFESPPYIVEGPFSFWKRRKRE